jgi:DNA-binding transcriptional LysR family regulator
MFDYNLLKVLRVLLETRNTKQAAERLNLSQ